MWIVSVRRRGATEKQRLATLAEALAWTEARLDELAGSERRGQERALARTLEPVQLVAARADLRGPGGRRGGIDMRGDGSTEAFTGWIRRRLIERQAGETSYEALHRVFHR